MTLRMTITKTPLLLNLLLLAAGCGGGQTGDLSGNNQEHGGGTGVSSGCEDHAEPVSLTDASALGFSAAEVLAFSTQPFEVPVVWQATPGVSYVPGAGRSRLSLTLTATGEAAFVHSIPRASAQEGGPALGVVCPPDRLRIPVHAALSTEDGALLEEFDTRLESSDPAFAAIDQALDEQELSGGFAVEAIDSSLLFPGVGGTPKLSRFAFQATLSEAGMAGVLSAQVSSQGPSVSGATNILLAAFPADPACTAAPGESWSIPIGADDPTIGLTGSRAVTDVNAQSPVPLTWSDGSVSTLRVKLSGLDQGCLQGPPLSSGLSEGPSAAYPATLELTSEDGRLAGSYSTRLLVERASGDGFTRRLESYREYGTDEVEQTGFTDVVIPNGTQRLRVGIQLRVSETGASGSLVLNGLSDPPCVTMPPPAMGNSSPGCAGTTVTPLLEGTWGRP